MSLDGHYPLAAALVRGRGALGRHFLQHSAGQQNGQAGDELLLAAESHDHLFLPLSGPVGDYTGKKKMMQHERAYVRKLFPFHTGPPRNPRSRHSFVRNRTLVSGSFRIFSVLVATLGSIQALAEGNPQAEAFAEGRTVKLPPYVVLGQAMEPWRYVSAPGLEVISRCSNWETTRFVEAFLNQDRKLAEILPSFLRVEQSVPVTMILITPKIVAEMGKHMAEARSRTISQQSGDASISTQSTGTSVSMHSSGHISIVEIIPQIVLWDSESVSMVYELNSGDYSRISLTPEHVQQLLVRRAPKLPLWFGAGIMSIYQEIRWNDETISLPELSWPVSQTHDQGRKLTVPEEVLPMQEFLVGPWGGQNQGPVSSYNKWILQTGLFLRWAYDDKSHARREALWKFADRSSREPVTEALFRQCFGMGYSDMEKELTSFIPRAEKAPIEVFDNNSVKSPDVSTIRDATAGEVGWIKGSFDLKEIGYVRQNLPAYVDQYVGQAEADLSGPHRKGARDPEFLAILGLYYTSIGKDDLARPLLEQATAAHVSRSSAYDELARIRRADATAKPTGSEEGK